MIDLSPVWGPPLATVGLGPGGHCNPDRILTVRDSKTGAQLREELWEEREREREGG